MIVVHALQFHELWDVNGCKMTKTQNAHMSEVLDRRWEVEQVLLNKREREREKI